MALLERVSTLIRANLNDLVDKAEDPEKVLKQLIQDMHNQMMQVKTQVAIAIADQHLLEKKQKENSDKEADWQRKAEMAVTKKQDDMARAAIERSISYKQMASGFDQQVADQKVQVESLKSALRKLEQKLSEAENRCDLLIATHRRARTMGKASDAQLAIDSHTKHAGFARMERKVAHADAVSHAKVEVLHTDSIDDRFAKMEKEDEVERLLNEIKSRKALSA